MAGQVKAVRDGSHTITAHLVVNDAPKALEFYKNAFGAEILGCPQHAGQKKVMHAEMKIGDSTSCWPTSCPAWVPARRKRWAAVPVVLNLYRDNIDQLFDQAVKAGATVTMPLTNQFWGDRYGQITDPFGHNGRLASTSKTLHRKRWSGAPKRPFRSWRLCQHK